MNKHTLLISIFASLVLAGCGAEPNPPAPTEINPTSITLNASSLSLVEGKTSNLVATVMPDNATNKTVTWSVKEGTDYVMVVDGVVTALKAGNAVITAKTINNLTASCSVSVTAAAVFPTSISLDKTSLNLVVGGNSTLTATVLPNNTTDKTVTWSVTEGEECVSVNGGVVTAIKAGNAVVTAKTVNDLTATCSITVISEVVLPTSVSFNNKSINLNVGESKQLSATVLPVTATEKSLTYSVSEGSNVISVNSSTGVVTGDHEGTGKVTVATVNGKTDVCTVTVALKKIEGYINDDRHSLIDGNPFESVNGGAFVEVTDKTEIEGIDGYHCRCEYRYQ